MGQVIVAIVGLLGVIIAPFVTYNLGIKKAKHDFNDKAIQNRYSLVYAPLRSLLLETHITGAGLGFTRKQLIKRALPFFIKLNFREGFKRLSAEFGSKPTYEVEFGGDFPLEQIKEIAKKNSKWVDAKLLDLIQRADRSTYETISDPSYRSDDIFMIGLLENEKVELSDHIWNMFNRLNRRLLPQV